MSSPLPQPEEKDQNVLSSNTFLSYLLSARIKTSCFALLLFHSKVFYKSAVHTACLRTARVWELSWESVGFGQTSQQLFRHAAFHQYFWIPLGDVLSSTPLIRVRCFLIPPSCTSKVSPSCCWICWQTPRVLTVLTTKQLLEADSGFHSLNSSRSPLSLKFYLNMRGLSGEGGKCTRDGVTSSFGWHWPQTEEGEGHRAISISVYQWKRGWHWTIQLSKDIERDAAEGGREGASEQAGEGRGCKERECGRQRWSVRVSVREGKGKPERDSDKLTCGKWDVTSQEKEMLNQRCQVFSQSETVVGDCRQRYWRWAASLMTARRPCFQQCWL